MEDLNQQKRLAVEAFVEMSIAPVLLQIYLVRAISDEIKAHSHRSPTSEGVPSNGRNCAFVHLCIFRCTNEHTHDRFSPIEKKCAFVHV